MVSRKVLSALFFGSAVGVVSTASDRAEALQTTCTVSDVAWATGGSGTLQVYCGGSWYYAFGSHGSCPVVNIDARKAWQSLAQSAFLSGKRLYLEYDSCSGGPGVTYLKLTN